MKILRPLVVVALSCATQNCQLDVEPGDDTFIACSGAADCPTGLTCITEVGRCVPPKDGDDPLPAVVDVVIEPAQIAAGGTAVIRVTVSEPLLDSPELRADLNGAATPLPPPLVAPGSPPSFTYEYVHDEADGSGVVNLAISLIDTVGQRVSESLGEIAVDADGPVFNANLVVVSNQPLGAVDTVHGLPGAVEAGALVEAHTDETLSELVGSTLAGADGSFAFLSLGENGVDESKGLDLGQDSYFLRATDPLGNPSASLLLSLDTTPAGLASSTVEGAFVDPLTGDSGFSENTVFSALGWRVLLRSDTELSKPPTLRLSGATDVDVPCFVDPEDDTRYRCNSPSDDFAHGDTFEFFAILEEEGAGNVGQKSLGTFDFDFVAPGAPSAVSVIANPTGTADRLQIDAGGTEPNAIVVLYSIQYLIPPFGPAFCEYSPILTGTTNADGSASVDIGDNMVSQVYGRIIDEAGNDPCESCSIGSDCPAQFEVANDSLPPTLDVVGLPEITRGDSLEVYLAAREQGPMLAGVEITNGPIATQCSLDGATAAPCSSPYVLAGLTPGPHELAVESSDALANAATETFEFTVLDQTVLLDAPAYDSASDSAYSLLPGNLGFLALGGDGLRVVTESSAGVFTEEKLSNLRVTRVVSATNATDRYVAYALDGTDVGDGRNEAILLAKNTGSGWETELISVNVTQSAGFDLAVDGSGSAFIVHQRCTPSATGCFFNGPALREFELLLTTVASDGTVTTEQVPGASHALSPQLAFDAAGDLWVSYFEHDSFEIRLEERVGGIWGPPVSVVGAGPLPALDSRRTPTPSFAGFDASDRPALSYDTHSGKGFFAIQANDGSFALIDGERTGASVARRYGAEPVLALFRGGHLRRASAGATTFSSALSFSGVEYGMSYLSGTDFGNYLLHIDVLEPISNLIEVPERHVFDGGSVTVEAMATPSGVGGVASIVGAANTTVLVVDAAGNAVPFVESGGNFQAQATAFSAGVGGGLDATGFSAGGETWVAHRSFQGNRFELQVIRDTGSGFAPVAPASGASEDVGVFDIAATASGAPLVAYLVRSPAEVRMTYWTGSAWSNSEVVLDGFPFAYPVNRIAIIGDSNGADASGGSMIVISDNSRDQVVVVDVDAAGENNGVAGCETCSSTTLASFVTSGQIGAGLDASDQPMVFVADTDDNSLQRFTYSGAWSSTAIDDSFVVMELNDLGDYVESTANCTAPRFQTLLSFGYGSGDGLLRIASHASCAGREGFVWIREDGAKHRVYFLTEDVGAGYVPFPAALFDTGTTLGMAWRENASGDVVLIDETNLLD